MLWYNVIGHNLKTYVTGITKFPCQWHYNELLSDLWQWPFLSLLSFADSYCFTVMLLQKFLQRCLSSRRLLARLWQVQVSENKEKSAFMRAGSNGAFKCFPTATCSSTICDNTVGWDLSLLPFPTSVKQAHYFDDIMLTHEDLPLL